MNKIIPIVIAAVVFGAAGFFGGMQYQKSQITNGLRNFANGNFSANAQTGTGARQFNQNRGVQGGFINGDIIAKDSQSVTVKMRDGSSKIIFYSESTQIAKQASGIADDLAVGSNVMVTGTTNSDGSITAQSISLRSANSVPTPANGAAPVPAQ